jgi:hypothetical protein
LGKEDISMAKNPTKQKHGYSYKVMEDTKYYRKVPREGAKPDGVLKAGTRMATRLDVKSRYQQVEYSVTHVKAWISLETPLLYIFRPTHETTEDTPYWFSKIPDDGSMLDTYTGGTLDTEGPPDGTLPEGTKIVVLIYWEDTHAVIRWIEGGPVATIDAVKHPLKPLPSGAREAPIPPRQVRLAQEEDS